MDEKQKTNQKELKNWFVPVFYLTVALIWLEVIIYASYFVPVLDDPNANVFTDKMQVIFRFGFNQLQLAHPVIPIIFLYWS